MTYSFLLEVPNDLAEPIPLTHSAPLSGLLAMVVLIIVLALYTSRRVGPRVATFGAWVVFALDIWSLVGLIASPLHGS